MSADAISAEETWHQAGDVAQQAIADVENRAKDKTDEALDAQRVHGGQTLDEFLAGK
jgi:hypothetical protein